MKRYAFLMLGSLAILATSCGQSKKQKSEVISQRYIHKYGYDVSREDWESQNYPGQVITTLRDGITITSTYDEGILHGPQTETYAHSLTPHAKEIYAHGYLSKKITFDIRGVPVSEEEYLSPSSVKITSWYSKGTPLSIEEYHEDTLATGSYFTMANELESKIENGFGTRTHRNTNGTLLFKDYMEEGYVVARETFYPSGNPNTYVNYTMGKMHGDKKSFGPVGEPLSIEPYIDGALHGIATYFQNGNIYHEIPYTYGKREGMERYFIDGETIVEEIEWHNNAKHGPSYVYLDGYSRAEWFYNGNRMSKAKYKELVNQDLMISEMHNRSHRSTVR